MLGDKIRKARKEAGLTQAQLAGADLSRSFICDIERNVRNPSAATIRVLAQKLDKPVEYFMVDWCPSASERALHLLGQAYTCVEAGDSDGIGPVLAALKELPALPDALKARWHELMAWYEHKAGRPLSCVHHALIAEELFAVALRRDKQWYCCYLAAHATYTAGLYFQTLEMGNRALDILARSEDMPNEQRLTLYLLGSVYFALGKIESAQKCYTEIAAIVGADDSLGLLQSYHGRAICAQHINDNAGALRWSEQAALLALERRDMNYYASALITWGSCLAKMGKNDAALAMLATIDSNSRFPARVAHQARSALLLCLAEQDPYPQELCISLEQYLLSLLFVNSREHGTASSNFPPTVGSSSGQLQGQIDAQSYEHAETRWAVAKSQLRRADRDSILPVIQQFSGLFLDLAHHGRAAKVLAYGASLMERLHDCHTAYILLRDAYKLNSGIAVEGETKQNFASPGVSDED